MSGAIGTHVLVYPYPTARHIIPLLDLTGQLLTRGLTVTFVVTPNNLSLLQPLLSTHCPSSSSLQSLVLSFPEPTISKTYTFVATLRATRELHYPALLNWFKSQHSPPVAIISEFLLGWSIDSQAKLASHVWFSLHPALFPNLFHSLSGAAFRVMIILTTGGKAGDPDWELYRSMTMANKNSWGAVFNTFAELEAVYFEHLKKEMGHDLVCHLMLTRSQMEVLTAAVEQSRVQFVLSVRGPNGRQAGDDCGEIPIGFEDRVADKGLAIKGWAPQVAILKHRNVGAFLTHSGWNSLLEPTELARILVESLKEDRPERVQAKKLSEEALGAVKGGSSNNNLDELVKRLRELENETKLS
ncbi:hypothetical protein FNV43_RR20753 [Rhamnella rubrinervis]|uniref:Uncharacterized protein n=1 Tax=Rhamnella rubrinervis TaxID=2594499 RepID=A0A8K0GQS0_9ROSA|nr:hypothetical protein FNV43_RR20753 [Rhamnella rubrinervis]